MSKNFDLIIAFVLNRVSVGGGLNAFSLLLSLLNSSPDAKDK